ncbi:hypothetical protein ASE67_10950 [Sphingomonas sp. Leaf23]|uniref:hypothetical protein n=1 Tax=Sphingomonas sp. Leaf23 TaxID=1735689 RepID=UPI000701408F|nr:hypothetical protein [Sphingomonas sp. Leaf23]KQM86340.1 hypothetical protein ASE67_10950 [Sphingomonas sp. Leaf23]
MSAPAISVASLELGEALAGELERASRLLGELAFELGSDETTLRRHLTGLQSIDHVTQIMLNIATVLRAGEGTDQLAGVTLEDVARRLRASLN